MSDYKEYLIIKKSTGQCLCVLEQKPTNDPIGRAAKENLSINGYTSILVLAGNLNQIEVDPVRAPDLQEWLLAHNTFPY